MHLKDVLDLIESTYKNRIHDGADADIAIHDAIRVVVHTFEISIPQKTRPEKVNPEMDREDILRLLQAEYGYWKRHDRDDAVGLMAMGAMGALSNVIAAVAMNHWGVTQNEGQTYGMAKSNN